MMSPLKRVVLDADCSCGAWFDSSAPEPACHHDPDGHLRIDGVYGLNRLL